MNYTFKFWQELGWAILVTMIVTLAQALIQFDATAITDWRVWSLGLLSGCTRAIAAIIVAHFSGKLIFKQ